MKHKLNIPLSTVQTIISCREIHEKAFNHVLSKTPVDPSERENLILADLKSRSMTPSPSPSTHCLAGETSTQTQRRDTLRVSDFLKYTRFHETHGFGKNENLTKRRTVVVAWWGAK